MEHPASRLIEFDRDAILSRYDRNNRLSEFYRLLMIENEKINLVSRETSRDDFQQLAAESLLPLDILPPDPAHGSYLDIGSGGGFPFVPILLAGQSGYAAAAERTVKKAHALKRILNEMNLKAEVIGRTVEDVKFSRKFDLISQRYVKLTPRLLKLALSLLTDSGIFVYYGLPGFDITGCNMVSYRFEAVAGEPPRHFCLFTKK